MYAELHCISNFSFLRGASHPRELMQRASELGYAALAITDECSLAGVVRAHEAAEECGLKLIVGSELLPANGSRIVALAPDHAAYSQLCQLISDARRAAPKGEYRLGAEQIETTLKDCLLLVLPDEYLSLDKAHHLKACFGNRVWLAAELLCGPDDRAYLDHLQNFGQRTGIPLVACGDVHMHRRSRRALQDTLTAIHLKKPVTECGEALMPNGERHLRSLARLQAIYPRDLLDESLNIAKRCHFRLDELTYRYPRETCPAGLSPDEYLRKLTETGISERWGTGTPPQVREQIEHELALIAELHYASYFLTIHDIIRFARERGILCQGRGSAANSAVCFCLGITSVDPARMHMLFERFISRERDEPPDIDVDFEHERREEVIQYIYEKYGRDRAALAATVISYRPRSAIRDVGKALGMELNQVDRLARSHAWWDGSMIHEERLRELGFDPDSAVIRRLAWLVHELLSFPRHLSQHVGGFVISDQPLSQLVPVENAAMPDRTVIQWDKNDLDTLGLLKVDCLGLGMLTAIHRSFDLIENFKGTHLQLDTVPAEDEQVYRMIQKADTVGVFQIESRAQMSMLPRLKPECFYDLVIEVAIVRPGPIQGNMVHPYLRRRQGKEEVTYANPALKDVLERTLGVPIFQEQVMKLAMVAAGFTPGEADQLRRSMAAWRRHGGLEQFERRLIDGMCERGYEESFARQIFEQIKGFGEYGFPESHAASFALLAYVSAWLKCHEPAAFTCALLNSQPMGFYAPVQLVRDARDHDVEVRPVDICTSTWDCDLERPDDGDATVRPANSPAIRPANNPAIRLGFRMVKGFPEASAGELIRQREQLAFKNVDDLASRVPLSRREWNALADSGALRALAGHRHQAHWRVQGINQPAPLFSDSQVMETPVALAAPTEGEKLVADYRRLGLTLGRHPLALLRTHLDRLRMLTAEQLSQVEDGRPARAAGMVVTRQRPGTATGVVFITLEDETGSFNVIVWNSLVESQRKIVMGSRLMGVQGVMQREGEVRHLVARHLEDHSGLLGRLATRSRDFH